MKTPIYAHYLHPSARDPNKLILACGSDSRLKLDGRRRDEHNMEVARQHGKELNETFRRSFYAFVLVKHEHYGRTHFVYPELRSRYQC